MPEEVYAITQSGYQFQPDGSTDSKSFPNQIILPPFRVDVEGRVLHTWSSHLEYPTGTGTQEDVLGNHETRYTSQSIVGLTSTRLTFASTNGFHIWVQPSTINDTSQNLLLTGTSVDEDGTETGSDTEEITIDSTANKVYVSDKRWTGSVTLQSKVEGIAADLDIVTDAGIVAPWNLGRAIQVLESISLRWRPWSTPWRVDIDANMFVPGNTTASSGGLVPVASSGPTYPRTFRDTFTPARGSVGSWGADWSRFADQIDPMVNQGFVFRVNVRGVDAVEVWSSFYKY